MKWREEGMRRSERVYPWIMTGNTRVYPTRRKRRGGEGPLMGPSESNWHLEHHHHMSYNYPLPHLIPSHLSSFALRSSCRNIIWSSSDDPFKVEKRVEMESRMDWKVAQNFDDYSSDQHHESKRSGYDHVTSSNLAIIPCPSLQFLYLFWSSFCDFQKRRTFDSFSLTLHCFFLPHHQHQNPSDDHHDPWMMARGEGNIWFLGATKAHHQETWSL